MSRGGHTRWAIGVARLSLCGAPNQGSEVPKAPPTPPFIVSPPQQPWLPIRAPSITWWPLAPSTTPRSPLRTSWLARQSQHSLPADSPPWGRVGVCLGRWAEILEYIYIYIYIYPTPLHENLYLVTSLDCHWLRPKLPLPTTWVHVPPIYYTL
jgi:hypothetical protein